MGVLIKHLPADSAFVRAAAPDAAAAATWSPTAHVVADLFDLTAVANNIKANGRPLPPYLRPKDQIEQRKRNEARLEALKAQRRRVEAREAERASTDSGS